MTNPILKILDQLLRKPQKAPESVSPDELIGRWDNDLDDGSGLHAIRGLAFQFNKDGTGFIYSWST